MERVSSLLQAQPFGFSRESKQLITSALVAQRQFEFVTSSGDRISHRSLDLQIIWDDIVGLARPLNEAYPAERLLSWAKLITGNKEIRSLDNADDRSLMIGSLSAWLEAWRRDGVIDKFDSLGDENLNAGIWKTAVSLRRSYGAIAELIVALTGGEITVEKFLQSAADIFSDSEAEFVKKADELRLLSAFVESVAARNAIMSYLSMCETTDDAGIEIGRQAMIDRFHSAQPSTTLTPEQEGSWRSFKQSYIDHYAERHDMVMNTAAPGQLARDIASGDDWPLFESFGSNPLFDPVATSRTRGLLREIRQMYCTADVREVLIATPFCTCSFELNDHERMASIGEEMRKCLRAGLNLYSANLIGAKEQLIKALGAIGGPDKDGKAVAQSVKEKLTGVNSSQDLKDWTTQECRTLHLACEQISRLTPSSPKTARSEAIEEDIASPESIDWNKELDEIEIFAKL
jgi:hypothetical protein